jgi:hypothetical protein
MRLGAKRWEVFAGCGIYLFDAVQAACGFKPVWINERKEVLVIR